MPKAPLLAGAGTRSVTGGSFPSESPKKSHEFLILYKLYQNPLILHRGGGYNGMRRAPYHTRRIGKPVGRLRRKVTGPGTGSQLHFQKPHRPTGGSTTAGGSTKYKTQSVVPAQRLVRRSFVLRDAGFYFLGVSNKGGKLYETKTFDKLVACSLYGHCNTAGVCICGGEFYKRPLRR